MPYLVALDPHLDLPADEFVAAWNSSDQAAHGPASLAEEARHTFLTPEVTMVLIAAAVSIPTTVIASFISEYLKKKFIDKAAPKVTVTTVSTPEGQPVWIIKQEET